MAKELLVGSLSEILERIRWQGLLAIYSGNSKTVMIATLSPSADNYG